MNRFADLLNADPRLADPEVDPGIKQEIIRGYAAEATAHLKSLSDEAAAHRAEEESLRLHALAEQNAKESARQWRHSTPLAIAMTGLITLGANFLFQYYQKEQDFSNLLTQTQFEADTQALEERLQTNRDTELRQLEARLSATAADQAGERAAKAEEKKFQYSLVQELLNKQMPQIERAQELLFLVEIGVLSELEPNVLRTLAQNTIKTETGQEAETTLPGAKLSRSSLTLPSHNYITSVLGPSGLECEVPLKPFTPPFRMAVDWNLAQTISRFKVHEAALPYFERAFALIKERGLEEHAQRFAGSYNARRLRGSDRPSLHSWGIAIHLDASKNGLRQDHTTKTLPDELAQTFEDAGFYSVGLGNDHSWGQFILSEEALKEIAASGYRPVRSDCSND